MRTVLVERRVGWGSLAVLALGLAALASACDTEDDGYVFEESNDAGAANGGAAGEKAGPASGGRGGTPSAQGGAGGDRASEAGGPGAEGGGGALTPEGGTAGSAPEPVQAGEGGTSAMPGSGGASGAAPEPTAGSGGAGDTTPPAVTGTTPTDGASNVPGGTAIRVQFSETLDEATVNADSFVVSANGVEVPGTLELSDDLVAFTPSARLPLLARVEITLGAEISDLAGNALSGAPYEWSFSLADGIWHPAGTPLSTGIGVQTAIDDTDAVVAWVDSNQSLIWAASSDDSENRFGSPVSVTTSASPGDFQLGSIGGGAAIAVWIEYPRVRSSRFTPGDGWSSPVYIDQSGTGNASSLRLATDEHGYAVAAWATNTDDLTSRSVWGNRFAADAWGTAATIDSSTTHSYSGIALSISDDGLAGVLCTRTEEQLETVWVSSRSGNSWTTPTPLESVERHNPNASNELTTVSQRSIHVENSGRMLAVWTLYTSGLGADAPYETRFVRSAANGSWGAFESFGDRRGGLRLAGNGSGQVLATFSSGASAALVPMRYTPSNGWSALTPFESTSEARGGAYISLGMDAAGNGLLAWDPLDYPRAARYVAGSAGAQWSSPPTALAESPTFALSLAVSRRRGSGVAAWIAANNQISARVFDFAE